MSNLKNLLVDEVEEVEPDGWDLAMIAKAEKENDGTTLTLEELAKDLQINIDCA